MVADSAKWYQTFARLAPRLRRDDDYEVDEAKKTIAVTEAGVAKVEEALGLDNLYEHVHTPLVHHLQNALRAKEHYHRDVEYIVTSGEVKIVDEFTGRVLEGRRYSEGFIRRSRRRRVFGSRRRTRPSRRSRSRTTSRCTRSSPG